MKVDIVFYGRLKQDVGAKRESLEFAAESLTVGELIDRLKAAHPALTPHLGTVVYVVGDTLVEPDFVLRDGDEAGLLPPVSGG